MRSGVGPGLLALRCSHEDLSRIGHFAAKRRSLTKPPYAREEKTNQHRARSVLWPEPEVGGSPQAITNECIYEGLPVYRRILPAQCREGDEYN